MLLELFLGLAQILISTNLLCKSIIDCFVGSCERILDGISFFRNISHLTQGLLCLLIRLIKFLLVLRLYLRYFAILDPFIFFLLLQFRLQLCHLVTESLSHYIPLI